MLQNVPVIIENFISDEDNFFILNTIKQIEKPTPNPDINVAMGIQNTFLAELIDLSNPIIPISDNQNLNSLSIMLTTIMINVKQIMSDHFNTELALKQYNYVNMLKNSFNSLHFDSHGYGEEERDYAALIYLNDNYSGGYINFPQINLSLKPLPNTLIFFKGDETLMHEVTKVLDGERKNLLMFFGKPIIKN